MKKFWLVTFLLTACLNNSSNYQEKKFSYNKNSSKPKKKTHRVASKFSKKIKPSESMQVGVKKDNRLYALTSSEEKFDDSENINDSFLKAELNDIRTIGQLNENLFDENGKYIGSYKIGNPYQVFGVSYTPQNYQDFEEIGTASWYGDDFHGKKTANGEVYDMSSMTAAHPTLPLPSLVRVTNLRNGKSAIVRVNDRGPFAKDRVIDVSEKAANFLGFKNTGTTEVKVQLLREDTDELLQKLKIQ